MPPPEETTSLPLSQSQQDKEHVDNKLPVFSAVYKKLTTKEAIFSSLRSEASEWRCVMWKRACGPKAAALHVLELKWFFVQENPYASKSSKASHCVYHPFSKVLDTHQGICWHAACVAGQWRLSSSFLSFHIVRICQRFFKYQAASTFWVKAQIWGFL